MPQKFSELRIKYRSGSRVKSEKKTRLLTEDTPEAPPDRRAPRFEHYELLPGEDGKPVEPGRGAMGVTKRSTSICTAP